MKFDQALQLMQKGDKMKLPSWGGYWCWDNEKKTVMMHTRDGEVMDIRDTQRVEYTLKNVASDEWIPAYEGNCTVLGGTPSFGFDTALKYLKRGFGLRRRSWNGNICIRCCKMIVSAPSTMMALVRISVKSEKICACCSFSAMETVRNI